MKSLNIAKLIVVFSSLSYLSVSFLRNYNSQENIEKRCILKFEKDLKNPLEASPEEFDLNLDLADNNYFKCMGIPTVLIMGEAKRRKNLVIQSREKTENSGDKELLRDENWEINSKNMDNEIPSDN